MKLIGLILLALAWGACSTMLFFNCWLSFLGVLAAGIGLARSRISRAVLLVYLFNRVTRVIFNALLLVVGFLVLYRVLPFGRTLGEILAYWLSATAGLAVILPQLSSKIDKLWRETNGSDC